MPIVVLIWEATEIWMLKPGTDSRKLNVALTAVLFISLPIKRGEQQLLVAEKGCDIRCQKLQHAWNHWLFRTCMLLFGSAVHQQCEGQVVYHEWESRSPLKTSILVVFCAQGAFVCECR